MKTIKSIDLIKMDNKELEAIIEYKIKIIDFDSISIIHAFTELNYRGFQLSKFLIEKYEAFITRKNFDSAESALNNFLSENGHSKYLDYRKALIENNILEFVIINPNQISKAGNALDLIGTLMIEQISSIAIGMLIITNLNDLESIKITSYFVGFLFLVFTILIIKYILLAGTSLSKSVDSKANEISINKINDNDSEINVNVKPSF